MQIGNLRLKKVQENLYINFKKNENFKEWFEIEYGEFTEEKFAHWFNEILTLVEGLAKEAVDES